MVFPLFLPLFLLFNVTIVQTVLFRCQQFSNSQTKRIALILNANENSDENLKYAQHTNWTGEHGD